MGNTNPFSYNKNPRATSMGLANSSMLGVGLGRFAGRSGDASISAAGASATTATPGANAGRIIDQALPFVTNIINGLRRPPKPVRPTMNTPVTLRRTSLDGSRNEARRAARGQALAMDRAGQNWALPAAQAGAMRQLGQINEAEANANTEIINREAGMNAEINMRNNAAIDGWHEQQAERRIAIQRTASENLASATDKVIGLRNLDKQREADIIKMKILARAYGAQGVSDREMIKLDQMGIKFRQGGYMKAKNC